MSEVQPGPEARPPPMPRWVKISGIVAIAIVAVVVAVVLMGGGEHGPGRHLPGGGNSERHTPPVQHST